MSVHHTWRLFSDYSNGSVNWTVARLAFPFLKPQSDGTIFIVSVNKGALSIAKLHNFEPITKYYRQMLWDLPTIREWNSPFLADVSTSEFYGLLQRRIGRKDTIGLCHTLWITLGEALRAIYTTDEHVVDTTLQQIRQKLLQKKLAHSLHSKAHTCRAVLLQTISKWSMKNCVKLLLLYHDTVCLAPSSVNNIEKWKFS